MIIFVANVFSGLINGMAMVTSGDAGRIVVGILMIILGLVWALMALANVFLLIKVDGGAACRQNVAFVHVLGTNQRVNPHACLLPNPCSLFLPVIGHRERGVLFFGLLPKVVAFVSYDILYNF